MQKKLLIIDDDPNISELYSMPFTTNGYQVETAADAGLSLGKIAGGFVPNAILLDIIMPGVNGIELLHKLCDDERLKETKIIIFSNLDRKSDIDDKISQKIAGYFLKVDMTPSQILAKVNELLA